MGCGIVKLENSYFIWSTIIDAPISYAMTLDELTEWVREEEGAQGVRSLPKRLARVEAKGTSYHHYDSADDVLKGNRAGPNERYASKAEILRLFAAPSVPEGKP